MKHKTNKSEHKVLYLTILYFLFFSFACSSAPSVAIAMPSVTFTYTPSSTDTPVSTVTVQPTATSTPSPTPTPLVTGLGQVVFSESFDDIDFPFYICGTAQIESGILVVERGPEEISLCGMFSGGIYGIDPIPPDTTAVILFRTNRNFNIGVHTGDYRDQTLRRFTFGLFQGGTWDLAKGQEVKTWGAHAPRIDSWYYFSIKRSANGDVDAQLWERDNPENIIEFHGNLGPEWGALPLTFVADFVEVPFFLDEYQVLK